MNSDNGWPRLRSSQRWPHLGWTSHVYGSVMRRHATKQILKLKNFWHFRHFIDTCHLMCRIAGPSGSNFWSSEGVLEQFDGFRLQSNSGGNSLLAQVLNDELRFDECPRHGPFGSVWSYLDKFQALLFWMHMQDAAKIRKISYESNQWLLCHCSIRGGQTVMGSTVFSQGLDLCGGQRRSCRKWRGGAKSSMKFIGNGNLNKIKQDETWMQQ